MEYSPPSKGAPKELATQRARRLPAGCAPVLNSGLIPVTLNFGGIILILIGRRLDSIPFNSERPDTSQDINNQDFPQELVAESAVVLI
jgi:hypothetical protein